MTGNIESAALVLGICLFLSQCGSNYTIDLNIDKDKISPSYCAGMKMGEAIKEMFK